MLAGSPWRRVLVVGLICAASTQRCCGCTNALLSTRESSTGARPCQVLRRTAKPGKTRFEEKDAAVTCSGGCTHGYPPERSEPARRPGSTGRDVDSVGAGADGLGGNSPTWFRRWERLARDGASGSYIGRRSIARDKGGGMFDDRRAVGMMYALTAPAARRRPGRRTSHRPKRCSRSGPPCCRT